MKFKKISKEEFDYIFHLVPRAGVNIVVTSPEGFLLAKRVIQPFLGKWNLPGGGIFFKEPIKHAIARIAEEELGIKVKVIKYLGMIEYVNDGNRHTINSIYKVAISSGKIKNSGQSQELKFFKQVPTNTNPYQKLFLNKHLKEIISPLN